MAVCDPDDGSLRIRQVVENNFDVCPDHAPQHLDDWLQGVDDNRSLRLNRWRERLTAFPMYRLCV
jgi:hypothetical protein